MRIKTHSMSITTFKITLVGNEQVGKTTWVVRHLNGKFTQEYNPTLGLEIHPLDFSTNRGVVRFNIWDCAGDEMYRGLGDAYFIGSDAFIIMATPSTVSSIDKWIHEIRHVSFAPILIAINKIDIETLSDEQHNLIARKYVHEMGMKAFNISAKSNYNFDKPLLSLIQTIQHDNTITFVERP